MRVQYCLRPGRSGSGAGCAARGSARALFLVASLFLTVSIAFAHHEPPDVLGNTFPDHTFYRTSEAAKWACTTGQPLLVLQPNGFYKAPGYVPFASGGPQECGSTTGSYLRTYFICGTGLGGGAECQTMDNFGRVSPNKDVQFNAYQCPLPEILFPTGEAMPKDCKPRKCKDECEDKPDGPLAGNPINATNGNKRELETDYADPAGLLSLSRSYNSALVHPTNMTPSAEILGGMGSGWTPPLFARLLFDPRAPGDSRFAGNVYYIKGDGSGALFVNGVTDPDLHLELVPQGSGFIIKHRSGEEEWFDASGGFTQRITASGEVVTASLGGGPLGLWPTRITDPFGHQVQYTYANNRLTRLTEPSGAAYDYAYDGFGNLTSVTYPGGAQRRYHYENPLLPRHLTGVTDENGVRTSTFTYDTLGRAVSTEHATTDNGAPQEQYTVTFNTSGVATVTEPGGQTRALKFDGLEHETRLTGSQHADGKTVSRVYDANKLLSQTTDPEGRKTVYTYNATGQKATETAAFGTPQARTTTYEYLAPTLSLPTRVLSPSVYTGQQKETLTTYNAQRRPVSITQNGFKPDGTPVSRTVTMQYNPHGQVTRLDGPRTDVLDITTFVYNDCTTGGGCGRLQSVTNALGQTTVYNAYDGNGRVLQTTDANGLITDYSYHPRGWVLTVTQTPPVGPARVTTYTYDPAGQLTQTQLPGGPTLSYAYDAAHYLRSITDNLGDKVEYTYDLKGRRIKEETKDPDGTLVRSLETAYNTRDQVTAINIGGSLTQQLHDALGNLLQETDPNNASASNPVSTTHHYDPLNRLFKTLDRLAGPTDYAYDPNDHINQITVPNGLTTRYVYDDLGNLLSEQSPSRGTLTYTHDSAGNVLTLTDARPVSLTYTYDALNRPMTLDAPGTDEDITYIYDTAPGCTHGIGRLCQVVDNSGVMTYNYDAFGNLVEQRKTELAVNYATPYTYDAGNRINTITYPDGRILTYTRDTLGRVSDISQTIGGITTSLLNTVSYRVDGLIKSATFGNGLIEQRTYNTKGELVSQSVGSLLSHTYGYDQNGNLTGFAQSTHGYDLLDRLIQSSGATTGDNSYVYEGNGDILNASFSQLPSPIRNDQYAYNSYGQLSEYRQGGLLKGSYVYNAQRQRTRKAAGGTTIYHYDLSGNLIQETTATGQPIRSYVWLNNIPVAQIDHSPTERITYLHVDHLNTPRWGTNHQGTLVWKWEGEAYGQSAPNEDVDQDGTLVTVNLRFPGGYFDQESSLIYVWNRYYDPRTGRWTTPDPIGLEGGLNLYLYAKANPLRFIDPEGLSGTTGGNTSSSGRSGWVGNILPGFKPQDWICSSPMGALNSSGCTKKCCVEHDQCYQQYGCNASSWAGVILRPMFWSACQACNGAAMRCVATNLSKTDCDLCK